MITALLLIIGAALADRLRGMGAIPGLVANTMYALLPAYALGFWSLGVAPTLLFIGCFVLGEAPGWGEPLGAALDDKLMAQHRLEWWQFGPLTYDEWWALVFRGAMWGVPFLVLGHWYHSAIWMLPAFTIVMPLAVWLVNFFPQMALEKDGKYKSRKWEWQEYIRGGLMMALVLLGLAI